MEAYRHHRSFKKLADQMRAALERDTLGGRDDQVAGRWAALLLALRCWHVRRLPGHELIAGAAYDPARWVSKLVTGNTPHGPAALRSLISLLAGQLGDPPPPLVLGRWTELLWQAPGGSAASTDQEAPYRDRAALGWFYQHWNEGWRRRIFQRVRSNKENKIERGDIVPATQLYTETYMVRFLLQNTLGAHWLTMQADRRRPPDWSFYVDHADRAGPSQKATGELRVLDPACGAGHFLLEAFELLYQLQSLEGRSDAAADRCSQILNHNLYGLDIDLQAVQLAKAALWTRAIEVAPELQMTDPARHLLPLSFARVTTELAGLLPKPLTLPKAWLRRLEHIDELGALFRPSQELIDTVSGNGDATVAARVKQWLQNETASGSRASLQLLEHGYDIVVTNPPFMGSRNMGPIVKEHIARNYAAGKRDLYTAFMLRCLELTVPGGRLGLVGQHSWMFLRSYAELRAGRAADHENGSPAGGLLRQTCLETLAHLGTRAFGAINGEVVNVALWTMAQRKPGPDHLLTAIRLLHQSGTADKAKALSAEIAVGSAGGCSHRVPQAEIVQIPQAPLVYWVPAHILRLLERSQTIADLGGVKQGLATGDNERFVRYTFECTDHRRWHPYAKGGGLCKWYGLEQHRVCWAAAGVRLRSALDHAGRPRSVVRNAATYFQPGVTYTLMARGTLGLRLIDNAIYDVASMSIFPRQTAWSRYALMAALNTSIYSYLARLITQDIKFNTSYITRLPLPDVRVTKRLDRLGRAAVQLKRQLLRHNLLEDSFAPYELASYRSLSDFCEHESLRLSAVSRELSRLEEDAESITADGLDLSAADRELVKADEKLAAEGLAGPQPRQLVADLFSYLVLRTVGHRWLNQRVARGLDSKLATDGIVSLTENSRSSLNYLVLKQLEEMMPGTDAAQLEAEFQRLMEVSLHDWLCRHFFRLHVQQFRRRPVAWQLQSSHWTGRNTPVFACLIGYHQLSARTLARVCERYVEPLRAELRDEDAKAELETFRDRLQRVMAEGFYCQELRENLAGEPLDEWTAADPHCSPAQAPHELLKQESAYRPDNNDGVRVNIAPLARAGLLAAPVLTRADIPRAIADRARWRAEERRWCRSGVLNRPGWWSCGDEDSS